ncbi:hypothetical protein GCM10029978_103750 [Actinoallomurus acanthiterrae]
MDSMRDRYEWALDELSLTVRSPGRWATLRRSRTGVVTVELQRDTLRQLDEQQLTAELQAVLNGAYRAYRAQGRKLREQIFGPDYDDIQNASSV